MTRPSGFGFKNSWVLGFELSLGFRIQGLGLRVYGLGYRVWALGLRVWKF